MKRKWFAVFATLIAAAVIGAPAFSSDVKSGLSSLEGRWKIVSSTEPERADWAPGTVFGIDIADETVSTKTGRMAGVSTTTQFIAYIEMKSPDGEAGKAALCVQIPAEKQDVLDIYLGYPKPLFWHLDSYPCVFGGEVSNMDPGDSRPGFDVNLEQYYMRVTLTGPGKARGILYYEASEAHLSTEEMKKKEFGTVLVPACNKGVCYLGTTSTVGIVELEFEKQGE